jgi:hypothetical protein
MNVQYLPDEIINKIFLYLETPEAKMIKDELKIYETDHNDHYTKIAGYYYVKNIISFSDYYFDKAREPFEYESWNEEYAKTALLKYN